MSQISPTLLDRFIARTHLPWYRFTIITALILYSFPVIVAYLDGFSTEFFTEGVWQALALSPSILVYILLLQPPISRSQNQAILALRRVIKLDDESFNRLVLEASNVDDRFELAALGLGAIFGFIVNGPWTIEGDYPFLRIYIPAMSALMFGALSWIAFISIASTKLQTALHQQPMEIDIFNIQPFEPIGRHSLIMSLAFIGGCIVSFILVNPISHELSAINLLVYLALAIVAVLVFFLSMRNTHRILAAIKKSETTMVQRKISSIFHSVAAASEPEAKITDVSTELNIWLRYEERLKVARTWPYNTAMLRTLFLSVLLPAIASLAQRLLSSLFLN